MGVSTLLSMWISNSGVTAMLIPIVEAVVDQLFEDVEQGSVYGAVSNSTNPEKEQQDDR